MGNWSLQKKGSSPILGLSPTHDDSLLSSPMANSEKAGGSELTIPVHQNNGAHSHAHALSNATALLSGEKLHADGLNAKKKASANPVLSRHLRDDAGSGTLSTMNTHPSQSFSSPQLHTYPDRDGERDQVNAAHHLVRRDHPAGDMAEPTQPSKEVVDNQLILSTSLLDPHPIIIPPPGSRLAFAGVSTPVMAHLLRALPSLEDMILRRSKEPLCLFNYWQYLADIEAAPEELEFWLSLADFERLHRRYDGARMSEPTSPVHATQPTLPLPPNAPTRRRSGRIESGALGHQSLRDDAHGTGERLTLSQLDTRHFDTTLDTETRDLDRRLLELSRQTTLAGRDSVCKAHRQCTLSHRPFTSAHASSRPTLDTPARPVQQGGLRGFFSRIFSGASAAAGTRDSVHHDDSRAMQSQPLLPPAAHEGEGEAMDAPTEQDMRRAAERLYFHYFLPESPAPLRISDRMRDEIATCVEKDQRYDAQLFAPAKRHAFMVMRDESYLRFLRERLFHNITRGTAAPRIALGLALIFIALTFQLALIFLDVKPKGWRWLPMAGLWLGFIYVFAGITRLDPFMALLGRYESTAWSFGRVQDKKILHSHLKRASLHLAITVGISAIVTLILFLVPGNRL
ncbi:Bud site selection protein, Revert to axial protein 1 [Coemansia guatemalensis]|uniref:Bud site selection protein, Revert to axial protein 1 n=1 Tax=Coemansia guatemalensis TaxID=2761395 RepID=A0A9W8LTW1_9FUNG|nr:Bud site selection protein, Revert to axial protein 1 [Coemansia guatemalensis]